MAQTNFTPISLYYSATAGNTPTSGNLVAGELAINTADGKLFYKDSAGVVQVIGTKGGVGSSSTTQVLYNSSGLVVGSANMTFNGTKLTLANDASIAGLTIGLGAGNVAGNTALGSSAFASNTTGTGVAIGGNALYSNTSGTDNVAVGYNTLYTNSTGQQNTASGRASMYLNTTGGNNSSYGYVSLYSNTTGNYNTALGHSALYSNTTASNNTAVGYQAGYSNTTGAANIAIGYQAGYTNTVGTNNTFIGTSSGQYTTGTKNTFVGNNAGNVVSSGGKNTIIGGYDGNTGGLDIRTASNYIVLSDGDGNPQGYCDNTSLWHLGKGGTTSTNDGLVLLNASSATNCGPVVWGNSNGSVVWYAGSNSWVKGGTAYTTYTVTAGATGSGGVSLTSGATSWVSASDARLKNVTGKYDNALADIAQLEPVKFTWKSDVENKPQVGVLAQSVEKVVPEAIDHIRVDKNDETEYLGVRYTELVPLLIAAVQELKAEVDSLKQQLAGK